MVGESAEGVKGQAAKSLASKKRPFFERIAIRKKELVEEIAAIQIRCLPPVFGTNAARLGMTVGMLGAAGEEGGEVGHVE